MAKGHIFHHRDRGDSCFKTGCGCAIILILLAVAVLFGFVAGRGG